MKPKITSIIYAGIKTEQFDELCKFFGEILGLQRDHFEPGFATYLMPNDDKIEIYGPNDPYKPNHDHFMTGPVVGFEVESVIEARKELEGKGIVFIGPIHGNKPGGSRWSHFRGPDGNIYEIKQRKL